MLKTSAVKPVQWYTLLKSSYGDSIKRSVLSVLRRVVGSIRKSISTKQTFYLWVTIRQHKGI